MIVTYDGEEFPGEVTYYENDIEVSVMHRSGNKFWKWPKPIDKICYERKDVIKIKSSQSSWTPWTMGV